MESLILRIMIPMAAGNKCSNIGAVNLSDLEHQEVINKHDNDDETSVNCLYITGGAVNDASVKQKNIKKLRNAMLLSYHHNDG